MSERERETIKIPPRGSVMTEVENFVLGFNRYKWRDDGKDDADDNVSNRDGPAAAPPNTRMLDRPPGLPPDHRPLPRMPPSPDSLPPPQQPPPGSSSLRGAPREPPVGPGGGYPPVKVVVKAVR